MDIYLVAVEYFSLLYVPVSVPTSNACVTFTLVLHSGTLPVNQRRYS